MKNKLYCIIGNKGKTKLDYLHSNSINVFKHRWSQKVKKKKQTNKDHMKDANCAETSFLFWIAPHLYLIS